MEVKVLSPIPRPEPKAVEVPPAPHKVWVVYEVKPGDALEAIARRFGVDPRHILWSSGLKDARLYPGQRLLIPIVGQEADAPPRLPPGVEAYRVRPGDTLEAIAKRFGVSLLDLVSANPTLESLDRLVVGSELYIPRKAKGLVVVLGEGQTLLDLAERFGLSPVELARANGVKNPLALRPGDRVLIPGVQAKTTYERLLAKQEAERRARLEAQRKRQEELRRLAEQRRRQEALRQAQLRQAQVQRPQVRRVSYQEGRMRWPLSGFRITTYFGQRGVFQRFHTGIDLAAPHGTPIVAARSGQVRVAGWSSVGYGFHVVLDHGGGLETLYAHMSRIAVRPGEWVEGGQVIGYVGSTGWSTGPHLHFEVRVNGVARNPLAYLP
ncbi:M23 family metallopeptidase [Thermus thermophilus]|uniref:Metalloendopeptidase-like membrane protein n=1 Tax=Thermus thermophilus JL-18 TaxID=798128 RepID=H9ZSD3_THETH|nr:M23 family metallopeptidase [Thermus thermophilus]AFH39243.1 metalloendopeptidase-like membrane protein [Thermus thermophilus JL-18]